jgi:hypothetical protein
MKVVEFDYYGSKHFVMLKCLKKKRQTERIIGAEALCWPA